MATLQRVTSLSKKILALLAILLIILTLYLIGLRLKERFFPSPPPPPTVAFGKLPPLPLGKTQPVQAISYELDTLTGTFPALPSQVNVYRLASSSGGLLSVQKAFEKAKAAGFDSKGSEISETTYQWRDERTVSRTLTFDVVSLTFDIVSNFLSEDQIYQRGSLSSDQAVQKTKEFVQTLYGFPSDIDESKTKATPLAIEDGRLVEAKSVANSHFFRVDFYQKDKDEIPIIYSDVPFSSLNTTVISQPPFITESHFPYRSITNDLATYPLKSPHEAFEELKKGNAYLVSIPTSQAIKIKGIKLAYLAGLPNQAYLMPVIVFEGQDGFIALVSAIRNEWIFSEE